ncbi:hypothetical protein FHX46_002048 [Amycolatopsis viridis]|uniref:Uncharacterized protein n=1 Tax=Amycolatopsis viridis TaxID=185678 RepID=A0ABX0SRC6_9PSEU|nr:hypothetical protein [Amycolatopsis viridis]
MMHGTAAVIRSGGTAGGRDSAVGWGCTRSDEFYP